MNSSPPMALSTSTFPLRSLQQDLLLLALGKSNRARCRGPHVPSMMKSVPPLQSFSFLSFGPSRSFPCQCPSRFPFFIPSSSFSSGSFFFLLKNAFVTSMSGDVDENAIHTTVPPPLLVQPQVHLPPDPSAQHHTPSTTGSLRRAVITRHSASLIPFILSIFLDSPPSSPSSPAQSPAACAGSCRTSLPPPKVERVHGDSSSSSVLRCEFLRG